MLRWYEFIQNNSGGIFKDPAHVVFIQAHSPEGANARAEEVGLYFDGCGDGQDCHCCGDRWYRTYVNSTEFPSLYGDPITPKTLKDTSFVKTALIVYDDGRRDMVYRVAKPKARKTRKTKKTK